MSSNTHTQLCNPIYIGNTQNALKKSTEKHFKDVAQNLRKKLDTYEAHFSQHITKNLNTKQCHRITSFYILSMVNPIFQQKPRINHHKGY